MSEQSRMHAVEAALLDTGAVRSVYQPIVLLTDDTVVGFEALARWPTIGEVDVEAVFATARTQEKLIEVEWACRTAALRGALDAGLGAVKTLFVNVEPDTAGRGWPPSPPIMNTLRRASSGLRIVIEVTERALLTDPAALLETVAWARRHGCGVALDDVGANPNTIALLPFVAPDFIKLDAALIRTEPTLAQTRIIAAVTAHADRTGAVIIAEGIETDDHRARAQALGASLGQGWLWGQPTSLPVSDQPTTRSVSNGPEADSALRFLPAPTVYERPSDLLDDDAVVAHRSKRAVVAALTRELEISALESEQPLTVLASFVDFDHFTAAARKRFEQLADTHPFVAIVGPAAASVPRVHGVAADSGGRAWTEWSLVIVGPHHAVVLIAHTTGSDGTTVEYSLTQRRDAVLAAGRSLIALVPTLGTSRE